MYCRTYEYFISFSRVKIQFDFNYFRKSIRDLKKLKELRITHIVNCASPVLKNGIEIIESKCYAVHLNASYYSEIGITEANYMAIPAIDDPNFDISQFFEKATHFIDTALNPSDAMPSKEMAAAASAASNSAKVVVHCAKGRSRSATIVIVYLLMRKRDPFTSLEEAYEFVQDRRDIYPNDGFLEQLRELERHLQASRERSERERVEHSKDMAGKSQIQATSPSQTMQPTMRTEKKSYTSEAQASKEQQTQSNSLHSKKSSSVTRKLTQVSYLIYDYK